MTGSDSAPAFDAHDIVWPSSGFTDMTDPVPVQVYGIVLDCPRCGQSTSALLAFLPLVDSWDQRRIALCNTDRSLAVADAATSELTHIVNTVGRPAYVSGHRELVNRCFHCEAAISGDDLAAEVIRNELDGLVDLGPTAAPAAWVNIALTEAGSFVNYGDVPGPAVVPDFSNPVL